MNKRIAVITGANRGLGLATAEALAAMDYHVVLTARDPDKAIACAEKIAANGVDIEARALDVSDDESVGTFFHWLDNAHGRLDVLVNNAGAIFERTEASWDVSAFEVQPDLLLQAFDTNAVGAFRMCVQAVPRMEKGRYGRIVNVSTGMAALHDMNGGYPAYRLSKVALNALTRIFDDESSDAIKVNSVCPGWVKTEMGGDNARREIAEGISGIVWAATLDDDGPSGGFFRDGEPIDW